MSVRNLQESYLFHDKKIYALVASALHVTCVLSVFFHSFLTQSHACSGQEGPGAELQQTRAPRSPDTARTQCSYGASLLASLGVRERPWFLQMRSDTPVHCPHSAGTSKCCQLCALVKSTEVERDQKQLQGGDTKLFLWCVRRKVCSLLSEHTTSVEVSQSAPDDPGECCHAVPASVTGRKGFKADLQCLPHVCTPLSAHHS